MPRGLWMGVPDTTIDEERPLYAVGMALKESGVDAPAMREHCTSLAWKMNIGERKEQTLSTWTREHMKSAKSPICIGRYI